VTRKRAALALPLALLSSAWVSAGRPDLEIAITIDDLPVHGPMPRGETPAGVARGIISALNAQRVQAYGFANGYWLERDPATAQVLRDWSGAGLPLGNHGWAHRHLNEITIEEFERELTRNDSLLREMSKGDWRWFRYPFLDEGETSKQRSDSRTILARHGYKVAAVTMDFSDWAWTGPYARCADSGDQEGIYKLEHLYLQAARESIGYYRQLSHSAYGRDIAYVLLLHASAFEKRMLPRLLRLFRDRGFRFVTLAEAESGPAYADQVDPRLPAEPQGLENKASAKGPLPARVDYQPVLEGMCRA
jgi:peptidoglycan-N-acetylglucosamine deacetylase